MILPKPHKSVNTIGAPSKHTTLVVLVKGEKDLLMASDETDSHA
jgi:hypothetical protein